MPPGAWNGGRILGRMIACVRSLVLVLAVAFAAPAGAERPRCSPPPPKALDSPASFANDLVGSLGRALDGTRRIDTTRSQTAADLLQAASVAQEDFACSARFVSPYEKTKDATIRAAAKNLSKRYGTLTRSLDAQLDWLRYLDKESRAGREPDPARSEAMLEKAVKKKDEAAQAVAMAAVESLDAVVVLEDGKPTGRLRLSQAEREAIEAAIVKKFGDAVRAGPSTENDFATNAASA